MSPLEKALLAVEELSPAEKHRLREILEAELSRPGEAPSKADPSHPGFGWARDILVIHENFDDPVPGFEELT